MVSYEQQMARIAQTTAFRTKYGGVIHTDYQEGDDLASNKFIGTATTQDVINSLINPPLSQQSVGSTTNLKKFLDERNLTPETAPDNWSKPEKQLVLRAKIAGLSQSLVKPPPLPERPHFVHIVNTKTYETPPVMPQQPEILIITSDVATPESELIDPQTSITSATPAWLPLSAILIGAGVATYSLMTLFKKNRGK